MLISGQTKRANVHQIFKKPYFVDRSILILEHDSGCTQIL